ncbi:MAG: hypothetical protein WCK01_01025 [Candidatus Uhrbacteria bacterium]
MKTKKKFKTRTLPPNDPSLPTKEEIERITLLFRLYVECTQVGKTEPN